MIKTWRTLFVFILAIALGGLHLSAQTPVPQAAAQAGPAIQTPAPSQNPVVDAYTVGQARPPVPENGQLVELTLDQAIALALEKNLDLKVQRMNPILTDYNFQVMRAAYRPSFTGSYSYRNALQPSNNVLEGVPNVTNINQSYNAGISQSFHYLGSPSVSVSWGNGRTDTNNVTARLNPSFNSSLGFSGSFNLLNGFKIDNQRNQWRTFPITKEITDIQLLNSIETTKSSVRNAYWQLRQTIEQIEIARRALELAKKSWADSLTKVEIGTAAQIDTITFESAVTNNEQSLLQAQISWQTAELNFKRLVVTGTDDELYRKTINPVDVPQLTVENVDIQTAVTKTLAEATNLIIARKNLQVSNLNFEVTKQSLLPNLRASGGYNANGQAGTQRLSNGDIIPGGYFDALGNLTNPTWNIGFNITYPLGQLNERAAVAQAQIRIDQAKAQLKAQELTTSTAVVNAGLNVSNSYKQYQSAITNRRAQERNVEAAQVRFDNGLLTNFEVVQAQNSLTTARLSELRALISYVNAIADFERVQKIGS
ncbi:MAG TPA: TolC family protein [Vicinamibacterales bacterium]|nr:TolC family protein [Vicinamibacterales bacterium]